MALESGSFVYDLNASNPPGTDPKAQGDDHIRLIKLALRDSFAGFTGHILVTGTDGGAVNAYTLTPTPALIAYTPRMIALFAPTVTNTGAVTLNVSGLGVRDVRSVSGAALVGGDLTLGTIYTAAYNGTYWQLLSITKNYADQLSFNTALPAQPGDGVPRNLETLNGVAAWASPKMIRVPRTANTAIDFTNCANLIDVTSSTFTQTIAAIATFPANAYFYYQNSGTGDVTIDPDGTETIDGLTSYVIYPGEVRLIYKDETGLLWKSVVLKGYYRNQRGNFNFKQPPGYALTSFDGVGGGAGGGSGRKGATNTRRTGGSPGGTPGRIRRDFAGIAPGTVIAVTEGTAGVGGAAQTVDSTNGNPGTAGGNTSFGTLAIAYGGVAGVGGNTAQPFGLVSGSGSLGVGQASFSAAGAYAAGGAPFGQQPNTSFMTLCEEGGAAAYAQTGEVGYRSIYGGASSVSNDTDNTINGVAGNSQYGVGAGGFGGWVTNANAVVNGNPAGVSGAWNGTGAAGGTSGAAPTAGANGAANAGTDFDMGNSGGGGGATQTAGVNAGKGGDGSFPGGAGGGGGACLNGAGNSGAGGAGQPGRAIIWGTPA